MKPQSEPIPQQLIPSTFSHYISITLISLFVLRMRLPNCVSLLNISVTILYPASHMPHACHMYEAHLQAAHI
jgi:hypothetical protein